MSNRIQFEKLYKRFQPSLINYAFYLTRSSEDAIEIVNDVFLSVWSKQNRLKFDIKKGDEIHPLYLCDNWIYWSSLRITSNLPFVMLTLWPVLPFLTIPEKVPLICSPIAPYSVTSIFIVLPEALNSSL